MQNPKLKTKTQNLKIFRIIDVNINRAVEGVRVIEDIVRLIIEDNKLTKEFKTIRSKIRRMDIPGLAQRDAFGDVGREGYTESEASRLTLMDTFSANMKRIQEALRVLEEFSKLIHPKFGKDFKKIRFRAYELEKEIYYKLSRITKLDFDLYIITDPTQDHIKIVKEAIAGGAKIIQLRDKKASKNQILKLAKEISKFTKASRATFIINDYPEIAEKVNADGVHLGQEDLETQSVEKTRKRLGPDKIIGVSTHSFKQALEAVKAGADYIAVGPIFQTPTKPAVKAVGLGLLSKVIKHVSIPVVAIGGIDGSNIYNVRKTGCQRMAVIRAVLNSKNMAKAVKLLRSKMG